jgi:hypothetical protein
MDRGEVMGHLTDCLRLNAGIQQPVPHSVEDVAEQLQGKGDPDPGPSGSCFHGYLSYLSDVRAESCIGAASKRPEWISGERGRR